MLSSGTRVGPYEIALALEAAHEKGVLHRDLKPGNVRLGLDGRVKLLDFGLARVLRDVGLDSQLATRTASPNPATVEGTAPYMSPEQARGQDVDQRSDVWAFGCVFFELLTGKRAFGGATFSDTVAVILDHEPDWKALPPATPPAVLKLLQRCLRKEKGLPLGTASCTRPSPVYAQESFPVGGRSRQSG